MSMYWIYDMPNWLLGVLTVVTFVAISVAGLFLSRPPVGWLLGKSSQHNDVVSYVLAAVGVFYGLALGLIAVGTWETFNGIDGLISKEAAALAEVYRDVDGYPQPFRGRVEEALRDYTRYVIEKDWPAHRRGEAPHEGAHRLEAIENMVMAFDPTREREKIAHAEVIRSLDEVGEQRDLRMQAVNAGLPLSLWAVVLIGAALNIGLVYLFWIENRALHVVLVASFAAFLALLIFLTAAMDNPFRGEFSVSPDAYQLTLDQVMTPESPGEKPSAASRN